MKTDTFVSLTDDIMFKHVFSHPHVMIDLLNSFFDYIGENKKIVNIRLEKDKSMHGTNIYSKIFYGDIVAILEDETIISVEMYTEFGQEEYNKSTSYLSRLYGNQLKRGQKFIESKKVISINFMTGNYHRVNNALVNDYGFVRKISKTIENDECMIMYLVRLDLSDKVLYNNSNKRFIKWLKLIKSKSMEEMKYMGKDDKIMEDVIKYVDWFLKEEGTTFQDKIEYEKAKGEIKGERKNALKTAKNLLDMNMSIKDICKATGLTEKDIHNIMKEC